MASLNVKGLRLNQAPLTLTRRTLNMDHKIPYVDLISDAILRSSERRLTSNEIFEHISASYGPMRNAGTLKIFCKVPRGRLKKKPHWWTIDEQLFYNIGDRQAAEHDQQQQQFQNHLVVANAGEGYIGGASPLLDVGDRNSKRKNTPPDQFSITVGSGLSTDQRPSFAFGGSPMMSHHNFVQPYVLCANSNCGRASGCEWCP